MDNSDDYFDDIVLDDEALAVLDAEEDKFKASQAAQANSLPHHPQPIPQQYSRNFAPVPPAKRQKTANGWRAPVQPQPPPLAPPRAPVPVARAPTAYSIEDLDLPEISVRDGFYGVQKGSSQDLLQKTGGGGGPVAGVKRTISTVSPESSGNGPQPGGNARKVSGGSTSSVGSAAGSKTLQRSRSGLQVIGSYIPQGVSTPPPRPPQHNNTPRQQYPHPSINTHTPQQSQYNHVHTSQQRPLVARNVSYPGSGQPSSHMPNRNTPSPSIAHRQLQHHHQPQRQHTVLVNSVPPIPSQAPDNGKVEEELAAMRAQLDAVRYSTLYIHPRFFVLTLACSFNARTRKCRPRSTKH